MAKIFVDFESPEHFIYSHLGDTPLWNVANGLGPSFPSNIFAPNTAGYISPVTSAKLELQNPQVDYRIHLGHQWSPFDKDITLETNIFLSSDLNLQTWLDLHRTITERVYVIDHYEWLNMNVGINVADMIGDRYRLRGHICHGNVDNNGDGANDLPAFELVKSVDTVTVGEWFKVKTYIHRDYENGIYKMWLNDKLQWSREGIRTIGVAPERYAANKPSWLSSDLSCYVRASETGRKRVYYDDVLLSNEAPELPVNWAAVAVILFALAAAAKKLAKKRG